MLVICDIDGTLIDLSGLNDHAQAKLDAAREIWGLEATLDEYWNLPPYGLTDRVIMADLTDKQGLAKPSSEQLKDWARRTVEIYSSVSGVLVDRVIPGVREGLEELQRAGHRIVLGTGNIEPIAHMKIERAGLKGFFQPGGAFGSDAYMRRDIIRVACGRAGIEPHPSRAAYIGDTPLDVSSALEAGVQAVAVTTGRYSKKELVGADMIVSSLRGLGIAL